MGRAEDRISYLPDPVLQSILTMLPLKSAIRTDVLSKKWRNLWKYSLSTSTSLEFTEDFANNQSAKDFVDTVNRYLSQNDSKKLERFRIFFCPFDLFASEIVCWISFATGKGVRYLDIELSQGFRNPADGEFTDGRSLFELPSSLFNCDSLTDLRVSRCFFFTPLNLSNFGGLQSLSISHSNINEEMLQSILTECSLLESLSLRNCQQLGVISITVPDLKLKRLTIGNCWSTDLLEINAPKLQSFHFFWKVGIETNLSNLFSLEDAAIYSIGGNSEPDYMDLLSGLSHVQTLTLCKAALVHLNLSEENYVDFQIELQNLHELQFVMTSMTDEDLTCFCTFFYICSSPFLDKLFILLPTHIDDPNEEKYGVHVLNPLSLDDLSFDHLKMIKVTNFKGSRNEMRLVSFLLQKAAILETIVLVLPAVQEGNGKERLVLRFLRGQVLLLRKASPCAQIILHEFGEDDGLNPTHVEIYNDYSCLPVIPCMVAG
ncbi:LOW QUALITY PROTEIN: F-box/LRR-repeat protein At3g26922-like [Phalaenopsis equestris]|uniref:LOW QUALITY PROTEIN: F-box/LRR-repeat protein At3g26922-like n=1 Tax=Phalaenopsis equestris TaxID=78828 RepID=UPI0009E58DA6|nr:LOW QUALITY PROTEIN: F-box/LRR-repeat protein At3g26922-like [Phalaenopsis equestris]